MHALKVEATTGPITTTATTTTGDNENNKNITKENNIDTAAPLVIVHGFMASSITFYRNLVGLAMAHGTVVYAVDLLGWGLSSRLDGLVFETTEESESFYVDALEEWRSAMSIERMVLAGHSMGGYLCVSYAEQYPEHIDRLILMVPAGAQESTDSGKWSLYGATVGILWNRGLQLESLFRMWPFNKSAVNNVFGDYMTPYEREMLTDYMHANLMLPTPPIHRLFRVDSTAYKPLCRRIPNLHRIPHIALIYADRDDWMKVEYGFDVQRHCAPKRIPLFVVKDAGHALMWKHPDAFNVALMMAAGMVVSMDDVSLLPIAY